MQHWTQTKQLNLTNQNNAKLHAAKNVDVLIFINAAMMLADFDNTLYINIKN